jgi:hypothetical protein
MMDNIDEPIGIGDLSQEIAGSSTGWIDAAPLLPDGEGFFFPGFEVDFFDYCGGYDSMRG